MVIYVNIHCINIWYYWWIIWWWVILIHIVLSIDIIDELFDDWFKMVLKMIVIIYCINWYRIKDDIKLYIVLMIDIIDELLCEILIVLFDIDLKIVLNIWWLLFDIKLKMIDIVDEFTLYCINSWFIKILIYILYW